MASCTSNVDCGVNAECLDLNCVCDEGWFFLKDFAFDLTETSCRGNFIAIRTLYSLVSVVLTLTLFRVIYKIKKLSQFKRFIPGGIAFASFSFIGIYKAVSPDKVFFGDDVALTISLALCQVLSNVSNLILLDKYVYFLGSLQDFSKLFGLKSSTFFKRKLFNRITLFISLFFIPLLCTPLFLNDDDFKLKRIIFRISFGLALFSNLLVIISYRRVELTVNKVFKSVSTGAADLKEMEKNIHNFLKTLIFGILFYSCFMLPAAVNDEGLKYTTYLIPAVGIITMIYSFIGNNIARKSVRQAKKSRKNLPNLETSTLPGEKNVEHE